MRNDSPSPSPDLLAANERLLALRRALGRAEEVKAATEKRPESRQTAVRLKDEARAGFVAPQASSADFASQKILPTLTENLPPHLGWESTAVTRHLRQLSMANDLLPVVNEEAATAENLLEGRGAHAALDTPHSPLRTPHSAIILLPALALAFLREERAAEGRLWLLLRYLDEVGRGWVSKQTPVSHLTDPASPLHLYHERYLRLLLARGDGVFWQWTAGTDGRIWLYRPERVAAALGVEQLDGRRVALPLADLLGSLSVVKAHFYASFHSARPGETGGGPAAPISRAALVELSGVSRQTQRRYEAQAGVRSRANFALGAPLTEAGQEEMAWQYGCGAFAFHDVTGRHGQPGARYQARQLPNSYAGPHRPLSRQNRRRYGRQGRRAVDLRRQGDAGNGRLAGKPSRRYYAGGTAVARALRQVGGPRYWQGRCRGGGGWVWYPLPGQAL